MSWKTVLIVGVLFLVGMLTGCGKPSQVWGKGDLPVLMLEGADPNEVGKRVEDKR